MTEPRRVSVWILVPIVFLICVLFFDMAYAGDDTIQSNDMNTVKGDIAITDRSYGYSGPDVDIAQCYRSWSFIIQGSQPNLWCFADSLDAKGLHEAAAITRCKIKGYGKLFESESACLKLSLMQPVFHVEPMADPVDDDDERVDALYARLSDLEAQTKKDADSLRKVSQRPVPPPQIIQRTVVDDGAARRAKSRAAYQNALKGNKDDAED